MKYVFTGGMCFVIEAGLLWCCTSILGWAVWLGATVGYWIGLLGNFTLNRTVMGRTSSNLMRHPTRYGSCGGPTSISRSASTTLLPPGG